MKHESLGNKVVEGGIINRCSCGWTSRPAFSNAAATCLGIDHRETAEQVEMERAFGVCDPKEPQ